jgi:hypothetical protein
LHRSLQLQILSWLAALATLGAAMRPTFDTILFAVAFVFGGLLMHVRERFERTGPLKPILIGKALGVVVAWSAVLIRAFTPLGALAPAKMSPAVLVAIAVIPTGIFLVEVALVLLERGRRERGRRIRAREDA